MPATTLQERAAGAIMGAFIGDALGLGPHWYYDLAELRRDQLHAVHPLPAPPGLYGHRPGRNIQPGFNIDAYFDKGARVYPRMWQMAGRSPLQ